MRILPVLEPGSIDLEETKARYAYERQKRIDFTAKFMASGKSAGRTEQYPRIADLAMDDQRFARMLDDPYVPRTEREPLTDEVEYAILGAGFGGLCAGARLREQGVEAKDIRIMDKGGDVGGTWYWNRYPGAMCDVESYCYLPLCEEMGYTPAEKYCHQPEMLLHSQKIMIKYGLYEKAVFGTEVKKVRWHEDSEGWVIHTDRGDAMRAKFVIINFGVFSHPKLPAVPGVAEFEGTMLHTSRWDYSVTGGSSAGGLIKLEDKTVGIIGTGATAVQVIPHLGAHAKRLHVFQRTPSTIDVRNNFNTTPEYAAEFLSGQGWQKRRMHNFMLNTEGTTDLSTPDLVSDGWTHGMYRARQVRAKAEESGDIMDPARMRRLMDMSDYEHVERIRRRCDAVVQDPQTAAALKPWYRLWCKRPCFHDDYLETFNCPNVNLVDTRGEGIQGMSKHGVIANGQLFQCDIIVLATGFESGFTLPGAHDASLVSKQASAQGFEVYGRGGVKLSDHWAGGPRTLNAMATNGFPNAFWLNGPQGVVANSATFALDNVATHIAHIAAQMRREGKTFIEAEQQAQDAYCEAVMEASSQGRKFFAACTPGYYSNEGVVDTETKSLAATFPGGTPGSGGIPVYFEMLRTQQETQTCFTGYQVR